MGNFGQKKSNYHTKQTLAVHKRTFKDTYRGAGISFFPQIVGFHASITQTDAAHLAPKVDIWSPVEQFQAPLPHCRDYNHSTVP